MAEPFRTPKEAALALVVGGHCTNRRNGAFCGQIIGDPNAHTLSPKQLSWVQGMLSRAGLPPLDLDGGDHE